MEPRKSSFGTVFRINMNLLGAFSYALIAWAIWPDSAKWWGFGLLSIALALAAPALLIRAIILMAKLYSRDKAIAAFEAANRIADPSELASDEALRKAGMIK
jgi:hypothetical protein